MLTYPPHHDILRVVLKNNKLIIECVMSLKPNNSAFQIVAEGLPAHTAEVIEFPNIKPVTKTPKPPTNTTDIFSHVTKQPLANQKPQPFVEQQFSDIYPVGTIMSQDPEDISKRAAYRVTQMEAQQAALVEAQNNLYCPLVKRFQS